MHTQLASYTWEETVLYIHSTVEHQELARLIGASVSEPLSTHLDVNFVCPPVCLSVRLSWTDHLP